MGFLFQPVRHRSVLRFQHAPPHEHGTGWGVPHDQLLRGCRAVLRALGRSRRVYADHDECGLYVGSRERFAQAFGVTPALNPKSV